MSALLIKLSIALFLLRICIARMQKVIIWVTTASIFFMSVGYLLMFIFQCAPSSYFWTRYAGATSGSCLNTDIIIDMVCISIHLVVVIYTERAKCSLVLLQNILAVDMMLTLHSLMYIHPLVV